MTSEFNDLSGEFSHTTEGVLGHDYIQYELDCMVRQLRALEARLYAFAKVLSDRTTEQDTALTQLRTWLDKAQFKKENVDADGKN